MIFYEEAPAEEYSAVMKYVEKPLNKNKISELSFLLQQVKWA